MMNKKNTILILTILLFLFWCSENKIENKEIKNKNSLEEKKQELENKKIIKKQKNKSEKIKNEKEIEEDEKNEEIEEKQEEIIPSLNSFPLAKGQEAAKQEEKIQIETKKVELLNFSGSFEENIKKDLEKVIVENVLKNWKIKEDNSIANWIWNPFEEKIYKWIIKEIYENDNGEIDYKDTEFSYKIDKTNTDILDFDSIVKNKNDLIIKWKPLAELSKITVSFDNEKSKFSENFYTLKWFDYWNDNFTYKASVNLENLDLWVNKYEIMAFSWDSYETMKIQIDIKNLKELTKPSSKIKIGKYCLLDSCLEEKYWEIEDDGERYIQRLENGSINYLFKNKSFSFEILWTWNKEKKVFTNKLAKNYIRTYYKNYWNIGQIKQEVFNKNGWRIIKNNVNLVDFDYSKNLKIWNINFYLDYNIENNIWEDILFVWDKEFKNFEEIKNLMENKVEDEKTLYREYIFLTNSEKQIYVKYKANITKPERIVFLWNDEEYLKQNLNSTWELLDLELSNKILGYYGIDAEKNIIDKDWDILFEIIEEQMPVFKLKRFNNSGDYMLYLVKGYRLHK